MHMGVDERRKDGAPETSVRRPSRVGIGLRDDLEALVAHAQPSWPSVLADTEVVDGDDQ
jgi:hypothetical protein